MKTESRNDTIQHLLEKGELFPWSHRGWQVTEGRAGCLGHCGKASLVSVCLSAHQDCGDIGIRLFPCEIWEQLRFDPNASNLVGSIAMGCLVVELY